MENNQNHPIKLTLDDGEVFYRCAECDTICQENGECFEGEEPCYYCPPYECKLCGRGFCDQSC